MDIYELRQRKLQDNKMSLLSVLYEKVLKCPKINQFYASCFFLYPLKTSEDLLFSDVFRGYRKRPVA